MLPRGEKGYTGNTNPPYEALDVRVPGAGPETPEEVPEEPETEPLLGTDIEI